MKTLFLIPTYNERDNIVPPIMKIMELPQPIHVLVIDDTSPDGTAEVQA